MAVPDIGRKLDAEVLTIGDELNRGEIVDTSSSWLAGRLTALGLHVRWRQSVNDDAPDMIDALERAAARADVVVCSGGLGPTADDRTVDVVCERLGVEPILERAHAERMHARFAERNYRPGPDIAESLDRQVRVPRGAEVLVNPTGLAPGFSVALPGKKGRLWFLPGPPNESRPMFDQAVAPELAARVGDAMRTARRVFRLAGITESHVDHALRGLLDGSDGVTLHFRLAFPEILVTLVVRRADEAGAADELERLAAEVHRRVGDHIYAHDDETLARAVIRRLVERGETLALAESCTGGLVGAQLTDGAGASRAFQGGVVAYADEVKRALLDVDLPLLQGDGAVSEAVARAMAEGARRRVGGTWGLSLTGVAGPDGGSEDKPVGTVWLGLAGPDGVQARKIFWPGERERVRQMAAGAALYLLWKSIR